MKKLTLFIATLLLGLGVFAQETQSFVPLPNVASSTNIADSRHQTSKDSARNFFKNNSTQYQNQKNYQQNDMNRRNEQIQKQTNVRRNNYSQNQYSQSMPSYVPKNTYKN